jgi:hypothetical protein
MEAQVSNTQTTVLGILLLSSVAGCPKPPDDGFEPNNSLAQATELTLDSDFKARAVQGNPDVLSITLNERIGNESRQLEFDLSTIGGELCPAFIVTAPDGSMPYQDTHHFCSRAFATPITLPGASLTQQDDGSFILGVLAPDAGTYFLTIDEKGEADNVFDYVWSYQVTPHVH